MIEVIGRRLSVVGTDGRAADELLPVPRAGGGGADANAGDRVKHDAPLSDKSDLSDWSDLSDK